MKRKTMRLALAVALAVLPAWASADGGGGGGGSSGSGSGRGVSADPDYNAAVSAIKAQSYAKAISLLQSYVARSPDDANGENWLAYAYRKSGQLDAAFEHYDKALKLDPKHLGAHEYVGEAYLMVGNLAKAEEHLKVLDKLCLLPCEQYTDLKEAVAAYKVNNGIASK
ncbi:MAG TPA: tetratricopeptide repeat protein [Ideonella sp.]|jgi:tetratricopeptide (TPR) repeat protein|nr:tetratricopeptide repeat protein [Ideonella sp.]